MISAEYRPPTHFLWRYVAIRIGHSVLEGPNFSFKMPRVTATSSPLWSYIQNGKMSAVQQLFSSGKASPFDVNEKGCNALTYATSNLDLTHLLICEKADPYLTNDYGQTPANSLWDRAFVGHFGPEGPCKVSIILQNDDYIDSRKFTILHKIVLGIVIKDLHAELEESTALINLRDAKNRTPLCWATARNDVQTVRTLLDFGADANVKDIDGHTALHFVQSSEVGRLLLKAGADVACRNTINGRSALHYFCLQWVTTILQNSSDVTVIDLLINAGIDVNVRDWDGETPLFRAVFADLTDLAQRLLEHGADPNIASYSLWVNAMHMGVRFDRHTIIPFLLQGGADCKACTKHGRNIAHLAARYAGTRTVQVLTESTLVDLDLDICDEDGKTPTDYITERVAMQDSEVGIHEAFQAFVRSIEANSKGIRRANQIPETSDLVNYKTQSEIMKDLRLPGAFPTS